jgi:hypothetical protein
LRCVRRRPRRLLFVAGAALLAAASLFGKAANYGTETEAAPGQDDERRVQDFLTGHGWVLSGSAELYPTRGTRSLQFRVPGCVGIVAVGLLPSNGEMASLFARAGGPDARVFHVHRGRTFRDPPRFAYPHAKLAGLMEALGFWPRAISSVVSVSQPQECRLEAALPWSEL